MTDQADRDAERLLPCRFLCIEDGDDSHLEMDCPAAYRPAVAAELRKQDERIADLELTLGNLARNFDGYCGICNFWIDGLNSCRNPAQPAGPCVGVKIREMLAMQAAEEKRA